MSFDGGELKLKYNRLSTTKFSEVISSKTSTQIRCNYFVISISHPSRSNLVFCHWSRSVNWLRLKIPHFVTRFITNNSPVSVSCVVSQYNCRRSMSNLCLIFARLIFRHTWKFLWKSAVDRTISSQNCAQFPSQINQPSLEIYNCLAY